MHRKFEMFQMFQKAECSESCKCFESSESSKSSECCECLECIKCPKKVQNARCTIYYSHQAYSRKLPVGSATDPSCCYLLNHIYLTHLTLKLTFRL